MLYNKRYFFHVDMKEDNPKYIKLKEYYILYLKLTSIQKKIQVFKFISPLFWKKNLKVFMII